MRTDLKGSTGSGTIDADVVSEIGVAGQRARIARSTLAQAAPPSVSRPTSSNAWTWTDWAPASAAARAVCAISAGVRGVAGWSESPFSATCRKIVGITWR